MHSIPSDAVAYKRTRTFDADSLPKGLRANHATKRGVWGLVVVESGEVELHIEGQTLRLDAAHPGVIPPEIPHHLALIGSVQLHVVFHRVP